MYLWISLYLPFHSLDVLFPHWRTKTPVAAVLHKERVYACTPAAQAQGVRPGMQRSSILGLAPQTLLRDYNPLLEQQSLQKIALSLLQYTPNLAFLNQHALLLEVSASLLLFNGPRRLWQQLESSLLTLGFHTRLGMAPTAQGAWMLAYQTQSRQRRVLQKQTLARRLNPLPISTLSAAQTYSDWLEGIGCHTLEQLCKLPRKGLQQRSAPALIQAIDAAYGRTDEYFTWFEAPDFFSQRYDLIEHIEHIHAVLAVAKKLIEQLCGWLHAKHYAVNALHFLLHHEKGRHARPPTDLTLTLSQACWQPKDFLTVLGEQLRQLTLAAPVIALELSITSVEPRPGLSNSLFPEPAQWLKEERRLLDLLRARLGAEQVLQALPVADYRPEQANLWIPIGASRDTLAARPKGEPKDLPSTSSKAGNPPFLGINTRPFWLLPAPLALSTQNNRPVYKGTALRLIQGPERLENGWWNESGHDQRDYFIAEDKHAVRYWIYRQRETLDLRWFLHGLFA